MLTTRLCVLGPSGKMGQAVLVAASARPELRIVATVDKQDAPGLGDATADGVVSSTNLAHALEACDVYVDFTTPDSTAAAAAEATRLRRAAVIGTTGLSPEHEQAVAALAEVAPVVVAANFSLGVNLLIGLVQQAAAVLGPEWDAEIVEVHHRLKRDAPSGTALALARSIAAGRGVDYDAVKRHARDGDVGARPPGEIAVLAVRGGDVIGEHTAMFLGAHERIELSHKATSRAIFAIGALRAASWVAKRPPGRYDMLDVLGLRS
jgi:4-hydroxy-tetrahydrodipicolinate reductase